MNVLDILSVVLQILWKYCQRCVVELYWYFVELPALNFLCIFGAAHSEYSVYCLGHLTVNELCSYRAFLSELCFYCLGGLIMIYFDLLLDASL